MSTGSQAMGHLAASVTILVWGTTFISTKVLLEAYAPIDILFTRFLLGFCVLSLVCRSRIRFRPWREERLYMAAGLTGVTLYFLFENIALTYTYASNVALVTALAPMLTAAAARLFLRTERVGAAFAAGFLCAAVGIGLISFSSVSELHLNPLGDVLAGLGALSWAVYSIITRKISVFGETASEATRHIFLYGLLFMTVPMYVLDFHAGLDRLADPVNLANLLFLGVGASALCFSTWTYSVKILGAVKTSVYIYANPVIAVICAVLILGETITPASAVGIALTLAGLILSQWGSHHGRSGQ